LAGTSTLNLLPIRVGKFKFTAEGECRWWCFSRFENNSSLPNAQPITINAGSAQIFEMGAKLFLCEGDAFVNGAAVSGPIALKAESNSIGLIAKSTVYGFLFKD
jgi:hypothetical protein